MQLLRVVAIWPPEATLPKTDFASYYFLLLLFLPPEQDSDREILRIQVTSRQEVKGRGSTSIRRCNREVRPANDDMLSDALTIWLKLFISISAAKHALEMRSAAAPPCSSDCGAETQQVNAV